MSQFRKFNSKREFMSTKKFEDSGTPEKDPISHDSATLQRKSFKDLAYGATVSIKVDPVTQATTAASPYAIIGATNHVIDGVYPGVDNLAGNILEQLMSSNNSKLVNCYDSGTLKIKLNYAFLAIAGTQNSALNKEMGIAINEALSMTNSEMVTQLPFTSWETSSPTKTGKTPMPDMDSSNFGMALVFYQSVLQNVASILAKYIQLRSLEDHLINMGFRREASFTHKLFGLLKKAAFKTTLNSISNNLLGEYFDRDWYTQMNTLTMVPSRKSNAMRSPLLTIQAIHKIPWIYVRTRGSGSPNDANDPNKLFTTDDFNVQINEDGAVKNLTMEQLFEQLIELFDQNSVLHWARANFSGATNAQTAQSYFNKITNRIDALDGVMAKFSGYFNDLRTYLDVMNRIGMNNWVKGTNLDVDAVTQVAPSYNQICSNVFAAYLSSPDEIKWDPDIQRWKFNVIWNEFTGIPAYDRVSGGSFLTFSVRSISSTLPADSSVRLVPKLFDVVQNSVKFTARSGLTTPLEFVVKNAATIKADKILSRLIPFDNLDISMRMPTGNLTGVANMSQAASALYEVIETVFGFGQVQTATNTFDISLNRDYICFIDVQMADVSNAMIAYARSYSPFRVWTKNGSRTIGFGR